MSLQALTITFPIERPHGVSLRQSWAVYALENALMKRLKAELPEAELDGHELPIGGPGDITIFVYGPSASLIADLVAPLVRRHWRKGPATLTIFPNDTFENGLAREL